MIHNIKSIRNIITNQAVKNYKDPSVDVVCKWYKYKRTFNKKYDLSDINENTTINVTDKLDMLTIKVAVNTYPKYTSQVVNGVNSLV